MDPLAESFSPCLSSLRTFPVTNLLKVIVAFLLAVAALPVLAKDDLSALRDLLQQRIPGTKVGEIRPSPVPGLYEVKVGNNIVFVTSSGDYMVIGDLVDLKTQRNLSAEQRSKEVLGKVNAVSESNMIIFAPERTLRTLTVFTDVDCPYCAKLHREVPELNKAGIKVRYMLYPRAGKDSETYRRAVAVWCATDQKKAISTAKAGGQLEMKNCKNPVEQHQQLGQEVGVQGTPTIVVDDGRIVPGYAPAAEIIAALGLGKTAEKKNGAEKNGSTAK